MCKIIKILAIFSLKNYRILKTSLRHKMTKTEIHIHKNTTHCVKISKKKILDKWFSCKRFGPFDHRSGSERLFRCRNFAACCVVCFTSDSAFVSLVGLVVQRLFRLDAAEKPTSCRPPTVQHAPQTVAVTQHNQKLAHKHNL